MKRILMFLSLIFLCCSTVFANPPKPCQHLATQAKTFKKQYKALTCNEIDEKCLAKKKQLRNKYRAARKAYSECALSKSTKAT